MVKRLFPIALVIALLAACQSLSGGGTPRSPDIAAVTESPIDVPQMTAAATTDPRLQPIPMHVGYGAGNSWLEIYFTDPTNPDASQETGGLDTVLANVVDRARLSVDIAIYSLSLPSLRQALLRADQRGVTVRMVMESDSMDGSLPRALMAADIPILGDNRQGLMHHKFLVIDRYEVCTGSMNYTISSVYYDNNNLVCIRSVQAGRDYTREFEEMFQNNLFGPDSKKDTPNPTFRMDGTQVEVYFSPDDGVADHVAEVLNDARQSIYFLAYSFTSDEFARIIMEKARQAGVKVAGVIDAEQGVTNIGSEYETFHQAGLDVHLNGLTGRMHHKVMIIDQQIVITGSYNFTNSAETRNDENLLILFNPDIAAQFMAEFQRVYAWAKP